MSAGRLLVLHGNGSITTCSPDGSEKSIVSPGMPDRLQQQPTWSPSGSQIAFSCLSRGDGLRAVVAVADPDGGDRMETVVSAPPFYFLWRPDGRAVAALGRGPIGFDLTLVEPGAGASLLGRGAPFFFDWAPDGSAFAAHIDEIRLIVGGSANDHQALGPDPGTFTAPAWLDTGIVAGVTDDDSEKMVLLDPARNAPARTICRYQGYTRFVPSPDQRRLAFVCGRRQGQPPLSRSVLADPEWAIPDVLCVLDLATGELDIAYSAPPVEFTWSPDGHFLLLLVALPDESDDVVLRWMLWDGNLEVRRLAGFIPTAATARNYLPFAEQYARSQTVWAPDSSAFCWAAHDPVGTDRVWVQEVDGPARAIDEGTVVTWSPV